MIPTKEEQTERSQATRALEAVCKLEYPTPDEYKFRLAVMKRWAMAFGLRELRDKEIAGPLAIVAVRPPTPPLTPAAKPAGRK